MKFYCKGKNKLVLSKNWPKSITVVEFSFTRICIQSGSNLGLYFTTSPNGSILTKICIEIHAGPKLKVKYFKLIYFTFEVLVMSLNNRYSVYKYHEKPISQDRNQIHCLIWRNFSILLTSYLTFVFVQFALSV